IGVLGEIDAVVLSDYAKGALSPAATRAIIRAGRAARRPVLVDPKSLDSHVYDGATLITPNADELARMTGLAIDGDDSSVAACRKLLEVAELDGILLTRGEQGMTLV